MLLQAFVVGRLQANCYVVGDEATREVIVIDPGDQGRELSDELQRRDLRAVGVIATHHHLDHTGGISDLLERVPDARFYMHPLDYPEIAATAPSAAMWYGRPVVPPREPDVWLDDGQRIAVGAHELEVLHCPGHTRGHVCLSGDGAVFTGDVLFQGSIGRHDFPGSDGRELMRSIMHRLMTLPDETTVYPGHGPTTTIGDERRRNPYVVNPRVTLGFDVD